MSDGHRAVTPVRTARTHGLPFAEVILPFTVLRRLDCVLEPTKATLLQVYATRKDGAINPEPFLLKASGQHFYNTSRLDLRGRLGDADHIAQNLWEYLQGFSAPVRDIFEELIRKFAELSEQTAGDDPTAATR